MSAFLFCWTFVTNDGIWNMDYWNYRNALLKITKILGVTWERGESKPPSSCPRPSWNCIRQQNYNSLQTSSHTEKVVTMFWKFWPFLKIVFYVIPCYNNPRQVTVKMECTHLFPFLSEMGLFSSFLLTWMFHWDGPLAYIGSFFSVKILHQQSQLPIQEKGIMYEGRVQANAYISNDRVHNRLALTPTA